MGMNYLNNDYRLNKQAPVSLNLEQSYSLVIERARQLVNQLIKDRGHDNPPFLPEEFARLLGFKKIVKADLGKTSAVLLRFHEGYVIKVNENHHPVRQNFSCAHEIAHDLLRELKIELNTENIEYRRTFDPQARGKALIRARERLCDAAAAELLMPESIFRKYLSGFGVSVHSIERLANIFKVSISAAVIRIAEVSLEPCLALMWQPWPRNRPKALRFAWRVGPGKISRGKANYMPVHTIARNTSSLYKAYQDDSPVKSLKLFKLDTVTKRLPMESKGFGRGENRRVISLAFPDR